MLNSLFLFIALYTISGKQAVPSGEIPAGSTCAYEQTGTKSGQLTAGNTLMLTLNGYDGMMLQSVTLTMHSNTSAGAGSMQLKMGDTDLWNISGASFSSSSWAGVYSTDWTDISHSFNNISVPKGAPVTLYIAASQNSLYLQSVALEYLAPQSEMFTVKFNTYSSERISPLTETSPNTGIVLPDVSTSDDQWNFYGWSVRPIDETNETPAAYKAGATYYPSGNCTLHAVYVSQGEQQPWYPTADLTSGDYLIALNDPPSGTMWVAAGAVENGMLASKKLTYIPDDEWVELPPALVASNTVYTLGVTNDTLTIRHKASNTAVLLGANGKFAKSSTANNSWIITPCETEPDEMPMFAISGTAGGKLYYISYYVDGEGVIYFRPTTDAVLKHDLLFYALEDIVETASLYSSFAFGTALPDNRLDLQQTYRLNIGPYLLTISNGKKFLQINE
ncbi:MAG: hypothetical protein IJT12_06010 [Paludibacteraceae bacterium]|nr:hypothetical protein [Paludibacteraceae bacterium]